MAARVLRALGLVLLGGDPDSGPGPAAAVLISH